MLKYKIVISYDGTHYAGWQVQPNALSIQELIEKALAIYLRHPIRVVGAGRTDAGVHAIGQVAHFESEKQIDPRSFLFSLNALLPKDIRIHHVESVDATFHAQYSARAKIYHYNLWLEQVVLPSHRLYCHHHPYPLSLELLQEGAKQFIGTRDFASFTNVGSKVKSSVRTLYRLDLMEQRGGIRLEFEGDGFLYKMVRNIVGTLLEVASKKRRAEEIAALFEAQNRKVAGAAAPPSGLFLMQVLF